MAGVFSASNTFQDSAIEFDESSHKRVVDTTAPDCLFSMAP